MNVTSTQNIDAGAGLEGKSLEELQQMAIVHKLQITPDTKREQLIKMITEKTHFNPVNESGSKGSIVDGKKVHPVFGEYIDVIVHPQEDNKRNTSIFVSVNNYVAEFSPRQRVSLPTKIVKFLKESTFAVHVYDPNIISENGNQGAHITKQERSYIVEAAV